MPPAAIVFLFNMFTVEEILPETKPIPDTYIIEGEHNIVGRGKVLVVDLKKNGLVNEQWITDCPIKVGESLAYNNKVYIIKGVGGFRNLFDGKIKSLVGLLVREL